MIAPHGDGELTNRTVPRLGATNATPILISDADLSTLHRTADGGLSPLTGPMVKEEYDRVPDEQVIVRGGKKNVWTIPLAYPVEEALAKTLAAYYAEWNRVGLVENAPKEWKPVSISGTD